MKLKLNHFRVFLTWNVIHSVFSKCHYPGRFESNYFEEAVSAIGKIMTIYSRYSALLLLILLFRLGAAVIGQNFSVLEGASPWE